MGGASIWHWLVVGVIVLLLFGRGKVSEMMGDVAKGIKAFKKGMAEDETPAANATTVTTPPTASPVEPVRTLDHQPAATSSAPAAATVSSPLGERKAG